jgi:hypothetical protein
MTSARHLAILFVFFIAALPLRAQQANSPAVAPPAARSVDAGSQILRLILNGLRLEPIKNWEDIRQPERTLIIVLGDTSVLDRLPNGPETFVRRGGALLVATDQRLRGQVANNGLFGIHVVPGPVLAPPEECFRRIPECPYVSATKEQPALFDFDGSRPHVATNVSGCLAASRGGYDLALLAQFPPFSRVSNDRLRLATGLRLFFAAGGDVDGGPGKCLILADHSVFINDMLRQRDAGNFYFTINAVRWLLEKDRRQRRDRVLLVENGTINSDFDIPLPRRAADAPQVPLTPEEMEPIIDEFLSELVREPRLANDLVPLFNEALDVVQKSIDPDDVLVAAATLLTFGLLLYGLLRAMKGRYRLALHVPFFSRLVSRQAPVGPAAERRQVAMQREGQYWEAAQTVACRLFATAPGDDLADVEPPHVEADGSWWRRRRLRRGVARLWRLATDDEPHRLSQRAFRRIMEQVRALEGARAAGNLRITWA